MRIFCVTENLGSGGAERQLTRLAVMLKRAGHEVTVVTWVERDFYGEVLRQGGVRHVRLPFAPLKRVAALAKMMRRERPDGLISFLPMANKTACLARLLAPVGRLIVSERSHTVRWGRSESLLFNLCRLADYMVANSQSEADNIAGHMPFLRKKTLAIPNFVETSRFLPRADSESKRPDGAKRKVRIAGVGRVIPVKNLPALLRALRLLIDDPTLGVDFSAEWYGDTYDKPCEAEIRSLVKELALEAHFQLMGQHDHLETVYPQADLFVLPSFHEGYPNVVVEAMSCGLPVACSSVCDNPAIVEEGVNGFLFDPESPEDIARALRRLIEMPIALLHEMGIRNREKVLKNNSEEAFMEAYLKLLES